MKMFSAVGLLGFLSISYFVLVAGIKEISIVSDEADDDDLFQTFMQTFQSEFDHNEYQNDVRDDENNDQVYGFPHVNTKKGNIKGQTNDYAHSFFGIPYAEAPIGELRFMPPVEKSFQDEIDASQKSKVTCYQEYHEGYELSEDCLVLNIHVPANVNNESFTNQQFDQLLPVMVFMHGGSFKVGSGTSRRTDGRFLSNSTNTVMVTHNHRLGALGYLVFEEDGVTFNGNQGFKDEQLALKWVKDNIQHFGGDPEQVTLFGFSSGAQSVMLHLVSKVSKPYFKRCIMESNPAFYDYPTMDRAKLLTEEFIDLLDCGNKFDSTINCLRNINASSIVDQNDPMSKFAMRDGDIKTMREPFRPVVDGDEFPKQPLAMFQEGNWNKEVEVIIGTNRDEFGLIKQFFLNITLRASMFKQLNVFLVGEELEPKVTVEYSKLVPADAGRNFDYTEIIAQEMGDLSFHCPSRLLARFISKTSASDRIYLYSWEHSGCDDPRQRCYYSMHGNELSYVFNTRGYLGMNNEEDEQAMSAMFSDFWGSFAYTGIPTSPSSDTWLKYEQLTTEDNVVNWDNIHMVYPHANIEVNYKEDICDFWDSLNYYVEIKETPDPNSSG